MPAIRPNPLGGTIFRPRAAVADRVQTPEGMHPVDRDSPTSEIGRRAAKRGFRAGTTYGETQPRDPKRNPVEAMGVLRMKQY